jgi:hypothetical protein
VANTRQMHTHSLDAVKGWFQMAALDFTAKVSSNVTITLYAGRCVHLNDDGEFETGCLGDQVPMFLLHNSDDPVIENDGAPVWYSTGPEGDMTGLVALGAYELETTEYDTDQTYLPNEPLRAIAANTTQATGGRLTNQGVVKVQSATPASATAIVGHVSRPPRKRQSDRSEVLAFWPGHYPGASGL